MNRNRNANSKGAKPNQGKKSYHVNGKNRKGYEKRRDKEYNGDDAKLNAEGRDNNPNWYFTNEELARQGSYLSFQQIAGLPFFSSNYEASYTYPTIRVRYLNPCPGVQTGSTYGTTVPQKSAINLAGFKLYSKVSAYTGRKAEYGPQDISTMILFMGEIISMVEFIRRVFGVAFTYSMRNRIYPKGVIEAMHVDSDDLFKNFSDYRMRFNADITRINQVPIPKNVAYFDKCASLYEKMYLDSDSPMATCLFDVPATTWELDETASPQGTVLKTHEWTFDPDGSREPVHTLAWFLIGLEYRIDELLNSSTFQIVYTDLLNLATKVQTEFWKFDYLTEGYMVMPEYNPNYLLQMHNETINGRPQFIEEVDENFGVTPLNDVWPNANSNSLFYNPAFRYNSSYQLLKEAIIDSITPDPGTEDRIEMTRFTCASSGVEYIVEDTHYTIDTVLPDHYAVEVEYYTPGGNYKSRGTTAMVLPSAQIIGLQTKVDWDSLTVVVSSSTGQPTGDIVGDLNYFTLIDWAYLQRLNDSIGMALYDLR